MDTQEFISYVGDPGKLGKDSLADIESLAKEFPYCQSLKILHLLNLRMINHVMYSEQLKSTAAHIADRKRLKELTNALREPPAPHTPSSDPRPPSPVPRPPSPNDHPPEEPIVPTIEIDEESRLRALKEIVESRLREITGEKETPPEEESSKEELIDRFIRDEPSITRAKADFFDPVKVARSSKQEQEGMVSETLARIHVQQGNMEKAIEIYRKLSLNFPEKSAYFAAQIKKISTEN
ncbi:MAG: hypothetical protein ABFS05_04385 [Bacteroidota bacterium]